MKKFQHFQIYGTGICIARIHCKNGILMLIFTKYGHWDVYIKECPYLQGDHSHFILCFKTHLVCHSGPPYFSHTDKIIATHHIWSVELCCHKQIFYSLRYDGLHTHVNCADMSTGYWNIILCASHIKLKLDYAGMSPKKDCRA